MPEAAATSNSPTEESPRSERNFWVMVGVPVALAVMLVGIVGLAIFFMSQSEEAPDKSNERVVPAGRAQPKASSTTSIASGRKSTEAIGRKLPPNDKSAKDRVVVGTNHPLPPRKKKPVTPKDKDESRKWRIDHGSIPVPTELTMPSTTVSTPEDLDVRKFEVDKDIDSVLTTYATEVEINVTSPSTQQSAEMQEKHIIDNAGAEEEEDTTEEKTEGLTTTEEDDIMTEVEASIAASLRLGTHSDKRLNFNDAAVYCRETYDEGSLFVTHTLEEEKLLADRLVREAEASSECDAILLGFHANGTKRFLSMDGTKTVDSFETAHARTRKGKRPLPDEDANCILIKPLQNEVYNMSCSDTASCVVCESKTRCQGRYITPWGVCYLPRTSTRSEEMSFDDVDPVCASSSVRGRVALFVEQVVPLPVILELRISAFDRSTFGCASGHFMARSVRLNKGLETFDGLPMEYQSPHFAHFVGSENDCVAVIPGESFRWKRVPCDARHCFLCRVPAPHIESKR